MKKFLVIWAGQLVSNLGSGLTSFAVGLWLYTRTESVTVFALNNVFYLLPMALLAPFAGALVDRHDRKRVMILADGIQAAASLAIAALVFGGSLQPWHIYIAVGIGSAASAFQNPAWSASVPLIVPKAQLGRASGLGQLSGAVARLAAPALAGTLIGSVGLGGIVLIDMVTFLAAVTALLLVHVPNPPARTDQTKGRGSVLRDVVFGLRYLWVRPGLWGLVMIVSALNLLVNFSGTLTVPMVLTFASEEAVGVMASLASLGMLAGTLLMSAWGGPQRGRVPFVLGVIALQGAAVFAIGLRTDLYLITGAYFVFMFCFALISTNLGPVWQTKVELDLQGRVFATRLFFAVALEPVGQLAIGPLTDRLFEPWMSSDGWLAPLLGPVIGAGPGRGMATVFLLTGLLIVLLGAYGWLNPRVRHVETRLPDIAAGAEQLGEQIPQPAPAP